MVFRVCAACLGAWPFGTVFVNKTSQLLPSISTFSLRLAFEVYKSKVVHPLCLFPSSWTLRTSAWESCTTILPKTSLHVRHAPSPDPHIKRRDGRLARKRPLQKIQGTLRYQRNLLQMSLGERHGRHLSDPTPMSRITVDGGCPHLPTPLQYTVGQLAACPRPCPDLPNFNF